MPAYQYSSAILFPVTIQTANNEINSSEEEEINDEISSNTSADDEDIKEDTSSNIVLTQQNYPNRFGLSFVLDKNKDIQNDLNIQISYRKYIRVSAKEILSRKIAINIKEYKDEIKSILSNYLSVVFGTEEKDNNLFVYSKKRD